ncbi:MAG: S8 family serine peptidase, partial [Angustibacter sp.]
MAVIGVGSRRLGAALAVFVVALLGITSPAGAVEKPKSGCFTSDLVHNSDIPWALRRLAPQRGWPLSRGAGVLVAVIGSGIDARNAQFRPGQVRPGLDLLGSGPANTDCDGTGTFVAGLIAARPDPRTTVVGLAPEAQLLPVRVSQARDNQEGVLDPDKTAQAITYAVGEGAKVIVVYTATSTDSPALKRAVEGAVEAGRVVVAGGRPPSTSSQGEQSTRLFPCGYRGVIGVAGTTVDGAAAAGSCAGQDVDIAAPGVDLVSTAAGANGAIS